MTTNKSERVISGVLENDFHVRPATAFVKELQKISKELIEKDIKANFTVMNPSNPDKIVSANSLFNILALALNKGDEIALKISGDLEDHHYEEIYKRIKPLLIAQNKKD